MERDPSSADIESGAPEAPTERFVREIGSAVEIAALVEPVLEVTWASVLCAW